MARRVVCELPYFCHTSAQPGVRLPAVLAAGLFSFQVSLPAHHEVMKAVTAMENQFPDSDQSNFLVGTILMPRLKHIRFRENILLPQSFTGIQ